MEDATADFLLYLDFLRIILQRIPDIAYGIHAVVGQQRMEGYKDIIQKMKEESIDIPLVAIFGIDRADWEAVKEQFPVATENRWQKTEPSLSDGLISECFVFLNSLSALTRLEQKHL